MVQSGVLGNRLVGILHSCLQPPQPLQRTHRLGHTACQRRLDNLRTWHLQTDRPRESHA